MSRPADRCNPIPASAAWLDAVQETALSAAQRAGDIQLKYFRQRSGIHHRLAYDIKLEIDRVCEQEIVRVIRQRFPDHGILTEESGWLLGSGDAIWIVDPLDGTVNFWHGLHMFCVSVACYHAPPCRQTGAAHPRSIADLGRPIVGVVLLPRSDELFIGAAGRGAFLNGLRIQAAAVERTSEAVVTVSFGKTPAMMVRMTDRLRVLLPTVRKVRCLGAAAAELAYVAAGFLDGLVYEGIKLWDFAAAKIILEEAGGFLEAVEIEPDQWRVMANAPGVRQALRAIL
jgi:fructose-1,6-bisphosphatase/inositol monophosphatase family enzyme